MASASYIAASGNRFSHCADSSDTLLAFGTSSLIALWPIDDELDSGVSQTLPGHEGLVTAVRFYNAMTLISGDDKGYVILWKKIDSEWRLVFKARAHSKSISSLEAFKETVVTTGSDSLVKVWTVVNTDNGETLKETQTMSFGKRYALALALTSLPSQPKITILAVGGTDTSVQLWLRSEDTFVHAATLSGHEDWIRCLDFQQFDEDQPLVLASGSQDGNIRLWNIEPLESTGKSQTSELSDDLLDAFEASLNEAGQGEEGGKQISLKRHILSARTESSTLQFSVTFDALLVGHEAGLTSLHWRPKSNDSSTPTILSTSTDSSLILWAPSTVGAADAQEGTSIWINYQRFGDVGGQRLGGFIGGLWANGGHQAVAWGWSGGWRRWKSNMAQRREDEAWLEAGALTGHSGPVKGIDWSLNGDYLISTGLDQTTRIHGEVPSHSGSSWHELGRPQVHGYDLLDAVFINDLKFASIADEKVLRVFEAPRSFVETLEALKVSKFTEAEHVRPAGASVPPLGLSNKAVGEGTTHSLAVDELDRSRRPFEGELAASTLWPEVEKVFGHGYESISLAISHSRKHIATACKATTAEHAAIRLYDAHTFRPFGHPLPGHVLTVTRISFSPDDKLVLTVSRDRTWRLFESQADGYVAIAADKGHTRIIWDCAWSRDGKIFATASRDKTVKIWRRKVEGVNNAWECIETIKLAEAATAVAFAPGAEQSRRLATGLEDGTIVLYSTPDPTTDQGWKLDQVIDSKVGHVGQIHQLAWKPAKNASTQLASCSEDGTLRIIQF